MSRHTAPDELLLDYAAGTLAPGPSLAVALHVALDPVARRTVADLGAMAGLLLEDAGGAPGAAADEGALERMLARLDSEPVEPPPAPWSAPAGFEWAPAPLARHLGPASRWRRILGKFDEIRLDVPGTHHRASLLRLEPGHGLPMHRHVGEEYTVVLQGGYTDATGNYGVGDFAVGPGPDQHEPVADPGEPCIALIVIDNPIVLTGSWGRWLNPLVRRGLI
ncbi:ChrR family anti-sigma-E factor [Reyranella sp.]|uniref:ChrR family anti-sigma-E factor n=1 Tax=Reyranella sp. TaxID=1929291 RepID=UPI003BA859A1